MLLIDSLKLKIRSESKNQEKQTLEHFPVRHYIYIINLSYFPFMYLTDMCMTAIIFSDCNIDHFVIKCD